jgi:hypothetical protein
MGSSYFGGKEILKWTEEKILCFMGLAFVEARIFISYVFCGGFLLASIYFEMIPY